MTTTTESNFRYILILLACLYSQSAPASEQNKPIAESEPESKSELILSFPILDLPYNNSEGYTFPSMAQSLSATTSFHHFAHDSINHSSISDLGKRIVIIGFNVVAAYLPLGDGWLHEEWHRAVMGQYGIDSYNEVYDFKFEDTIAVSRVSDQELIWLKQTHPADLVRLHSAGIESQYELGLALEKDLFYQNVTTWDFPTLWLNYANNIGYLTLCASNQSDDLTYDIQKSENQDISKRDFTGLDCDAWVYDLYRPNEPYTARGTHPSGVGIDRYISYSDLTLEERNYLKRQANLSFLNLLNPFLFAKTKFRLDNNSPWWWNASLRHHLTPFGYNIGVNLFAKDNRLKLFTTLNYFANKKKQFLGLDATLLRVPAHLVNLPIQATLRAALWQQPDNQQFYDSHGKLGGLISATAYHKLGTNGEIYVQLSGKSQGWVPGEVKLGKEIAVKIGIGHYIKD